MRFAFLLLVIPAVAVAQDGDAEKQFRELEGKLEKARTVSLSFQGKSGLAGQQGQELKGSYKAGPGERTEFAFTPPGGGNPLSIKLVAEGGELTMYGGPMGKALMTRAAPDGYSKSVRTAMTRIGPVAWAFIAGPLGGGLAPKEAGNSPSFTPSKFTLGEKTKIGERDALLLEYTVHLDTPGKQKEDKDKDKVGQDTGSVKVWLDAETKLPLKREVNLPKGEMRLRIVETYSDFKVDQKAPEKRPDTEKKDKKDEEKTPPKDPGKKSD